MPAVTGYFAPSEEDLAKGGDDFPVLDEDEYIAKITSITVESMKNNFTI